MRATELTGDELLQVLATLANPHRLRVVAALTQEPLLFKGEDFARTDVAAVSGGE